MTAPEHAVGVTLVRRGGVNVLQRGDEEPVALNDVALALWELCDGETTPEEMAAAAAAVFDAPEQQLRDDISATLEELTDRGFLVWTAPDS